LIVAASRQSAANLWKLKNAAFLPESRYGLFLKMNQIMKSIHPLCIAAFYLLALPVAHADDFRLEPGYMSLFNGFDLTGWGYLTNNFNGKTASDDGRFSAADGILTVHPRVPRLLQKISTTIEFSNNFNLKLEFRAATNADSGIFHPQATVAMPRLPRRRDLTKI